ncbi:hypothetical protein [Parasphingorhabdus sp.]|uniref:hypothetical protein n=1 Tax=Parasphingorhabdus sp. TaxID=2709688 RepID=UPI003D2C7167
MIREILVGVSGSAAVLVIDLFVVRWSGDSNGTRAAVAVTIFVIAFCVTRLLPSRDNSKRMILSDNKVSGAMSVDAKEVSADAAEKLLSSNKTSGDLKVKANKISS